MNTEQHAEDGTTGVPRFASHSAMSRFDRWRINAPEGYRWDNAEVLAEKTQSFLNGVLFGVVLVFIAALIVAVVT